MEFTKLIETTGTTAGDWQDIQHAQAPNGTKLFEIGVGVYRVDFQELGNDHKQIYFDWTAAAANYHYHAGQDESMKKAPSRPDWRAWQRPACEMSVEEAATLNCSAIDA